MFPDFKYKLSCHMHRRRLKGLITVSIAGLRGSSLRFPPIGFVLTTKPGDPRQGEYGVVGYHTASIVRLIL